MGGPNLSRRAPAPFCYEGSVARQDERGRVVVTVTLPRYVRRCRFDALARRTLTCGFLAKSRVLDVHQSCKCVHTGLKRASDGPQTPQSTEKSVGNLSNHSRLPSWLARRAQNPGVGYRIIGRQRLGFSACTSRPCQRGIDTSTPPVRSATAGREMRAFCQLRAYKSRRLRFVRI